MWDQLTALFEGNEFLAGGALLGASGLAVAWGRQLFFRALHYVPQLFFCRCDLDSYLGGEAVNWVSTWLADQPSIKRSKRVFLRSHTHRSEPQLIPTSGNHRVYWNGKLIIFNRNWTEGSGKNSANGVIREQWTLLLRGSRSDLDEFIVDCFKHYQGQALVQLQIYVCASWGHWEQSSRQRRSIETVVMDGDQRDQIVEEIDEFWKSREWYTERGIPWRRGYMLHGPPGNGKTTFAIAIASHFRKPLYVLNLNAPDSTAQAMQVLMNIPEDVVLLIEDIDRTHAKPTEGQEQNQPIDHATLLNLIDGVFATDGRLLFITTNHPEKLDEALKRPGRVDREIHFRPSLDQFAKLYVLFFPDDEQSAAEFAERVADRLSRDDELPSIAAVQEFLVRYGDRCWDELAGEPVSGERVA